MMDIGALFLVLAVLLVVAVYITQPFLAHRGRRVTAEEVHHSALLAEYERVLNTLQELDFDHHLGKIPEEEYPLLRAELIKKGTLLLQQLEASQVQLSQQEAETRLEKAMAKYRAEHGGERRSRLSDDELEKLLAARRAARKGKRSGFCPACGQPVLAEDRFCASCGRALK
ncbi:MAG: zinc-ribbon domain-containing protein [Anaerolineales bacterium]